MTDSVAESSAEISHTHRPSVGTNQDVTQVGDPSGRQTGLRFAPPVARGDVGALGAYRILKQLGKGGMGAVYLALDTRLDRKLALKVMLPEAAADADAKERFLREARAAAKINHDNVVTVYEADERNDIPYIAMQFLQGYPLDEYLKIKGPPALPHSVRIARETAQGLAAAHDLGLVHRDIKPGNLWLEAPHGRVKVLDFGLAKPVGAEIDLTQSGMVVGTPAYMSPEQGRGLKVDARSDLFSLGVVLYRLCSGKIPFDGATVMDVLIALGTKDPVPVRSVNPDVPESLAELVHQLLAKAPENRPQTATEVARRLRAIAAQLNQPRPVDGSHSQPIVVHPVPVGSALHVSFSPPSAFEDLGAESTPVGEPAAPKPLRKRVGGRGAQVAALFAVLAAVLMAGVIVIKITNKDGTVTEIQVPDGSKVEVNGKAVTPEPKEPKEPKGPKKGALGADPDRKAAEYVLSLGGGTVRVEGDGRDIEAAAELPRGEFRLTSIFVNGSDQLADADLAAFNDCKSLTSLFLHACNRVTDAGLAHFKDRKNLLYLSLALTPVTDAGLVHFKGCKGLLKINLQGAGVTDAGLAHFKGCKDLRALSLRDCRGFTSAGLAAFKDCADLEDLDLVNTPVTDAGLAHFKDRKNLQTLGLVGTRVTDAGLETVKEWKKLTYIELKDTQIGDAGLVHLRGLENLKDLHLTETKVTAKGVEGLAKALPRCRIEWNGGVSEPMDPDRKAAVYALSVGATVRVAGDNRDIAAAADLPRGALRLTLVNFDGNKQVTDAGLAAFTGCSALTELNLARCPQVTDAGLAHFRGAKNLEVVRLFGCTRLTDAGLDHIRDHKNLKFVNLTGAQVTPKGLKDLMLARPGCVVESDARAIEALDPDRRAAEYVLSIGSTVRVRGDPRYIAVAADLPRGPILALHAALNNNPKVTDAGLAVFKECQSLAYLELCGVPVTDAGLAHFKDCKTLEALNLLGTPVTEAGLANFKNCTNLLMLVLKNTGATDAGLAHFKDCTNILHLDLFGTKVTDAGLAHFKGCKRLSVLDVTGTGVTDIGLAHFKECASLMYLQVGDCAGVSDAGLSHFKGCSEMRRVQLNGTGVTDAGLAHLAGFDKLTELNLTGTKVTAKGVADLRKRLPKCKITWDEPRK